MKDYIDAAAFKEMILCADTALHENVQAINELNVFPVPDGDTGTNMSLTMQNAAKELRKRDFTTIEEVSDCVASALLRGARGNSGVILSLLFRGIAKRLRGLETAGTEEFAGALNDGVEAAYKAVMKPAEGTILTVSKRASKAALEAAQLGSDFEGMLICAVKEGNRALEDTREINPVLKKAGVVDAGGKGYMVILSTILASLRGEAAHTGSSSVIEACITPFDAFSTEEITFAYDTVFIVRKSVPDVNIDRFRAYLGSIGDSLVISEDDEIFKVHVHTDIPGEALNEAGKYGTLELAKIENMKMQHDDLLAGRKARSTDDLDETEPEEQPAAPVKEFGVVAVCAGNGFEELFKELGVDRTVTGGQTMNPSTDDILSEIEKTPASTVFVLPNNKNIIMAAEQCIPLSSKRVIVLQTKTVPQGISAMLNYNPEAGDAAAVGEAMKAGFSSVRTIQVTYAARDSEYDGEPIKAGEYLSLVDGALGGSFGDIKAVLKALARKIERMAPEFVTIYYGADIAEGEARRMAESLSAIVKDAEINVVYGGQPVYYYTIAVE